MLLPRARQYGPVVLEHVPLCCLIVVVVFSVRSLPVLTFFVRYFATTHSRFYQRTRGVGVGVRQADRPTNPVSFSMPSLDFP